MESPVSRKFSQLGPEMSKALTEKLVAEMRPTIEPKIQALQASMEKDLGLNPAPAAGVAPPASAPARKK
jgi:hypothetical protein